MLFPPPTHPKAGKNCTLSGALVTTLRLIKRYWVSHVYLKWITWNKFMLNRKGRAMNVTFFPILMWIRISFPDSAHTHPDLNCRRLSRQQTYCWHLAISSIIVLEPKIPTNHKSRLTIFNQLQFEGGSVASIRNIMVMMKLTENSALINEL